MPKIDINGLCKKRTAADTAAGRGVTSITFMVNVESA
jgi:hypothetical protein